jgi:arylsulfatase A-like enzyme
MRKIGVVLASVALAVGALFLSSYLGPAGSMRKAKALTAPAKPNIVFILSDDMRKDDLKYMPKTRSLLKDRGMSFENAFVSHALCAPSRATIMRGQYAHNTHVLSNSSTDSPTTSIGGWQAYRKNGDETDNVATRLNGVGYRTGLFGKYMNRYANTTHVPRGWDRWFATWSRGDPKYFDYDVNDDGTTRHFGTSVGDYKTDVLRRQTRKFIGTSVRHHRHFFAYVAPIAPHKPATPAPRDLHAYDGLKGPRLPSTRPTSRRSPPGYDGCPSSPTTESAR